jgi:integrase
MGRGSLQVRHKKGCAGKGSSSRGCSCRPTVYAVLYVGSRHQRRRLGYLEKGWASRDLRQFEDDLASLRRRLETGRPLQQHEPITLTEYAETFFHELYAAAEAGRISRLTFNTYEGHWHNHLEPAFGKEPMAAIDQRALRRYVSQKVAAGLSPSTVNATLTPLSAMFSDAVGEGRLAANPVSQPRRARHGGSRRTAILADVKRKPPKHLEPVEARALLAATPATYRPMVLAALTTGVRRGELLGLRWDELDFGKDRVTLSAQLQRKKRVRCKNGSERELPLYAGLARELGPCRRATGYVFTTPDGEPWSDSGPERAFLVDAYERAGLREKVDRRVAGERHRQHLWHALRHTYVSALRAAGIREDVIAELVGHKRQGITARYTHLFADAFDDVEKALDALLGECHEGVTDDGAEDQLSQGTVTENPDLVRS